jgi:hypothetical protein
MTISTLARKSKSTASRLSPEERRRLSKLVSAEELEECYQSYLIAFGNTRKELPTPDLLDDGGDGSNAVHIQKLLSPTDLGVEHEKKLTREQLIESLGIVGHRVLPWVHEAVNKLPQDIWAANLTGDETSAIRRSMDDLAASTKELPDGWTLLKHHDHQLDAIHAVIRLLKAEGPKQGVLVADDVGIGKTGSALGVLAMMIHYRQIDIDAKNANIEPTGNVKTLTTQLVLQYVTNILAVVAAAVFFFCFCFLQVGGLYGGSVPYPQGPHLIVATKTLISNWVNEIHMWLKGVEVFIYDGGDEKRKAFFEPDSLWLKSTAPMHRRIILTTDKVSFAHYSQCQSPLRKEKHII